MPISKRNNFMKYARGIRRTKRGTIRRMFCGAAKSVEARPKGTRPNNPNKIILIKKHRQKIKQF